MKVLAIILFIFCCSTFAASSDDGGKKAKQELKLKLKLFTLHMKESLKLLHTANGVNNGKNCISTTYKGIEKR